MSARATDPGTDPGTHPGTHPASRPAAGDPAVAEVRAVLAVVGRGDLAFAPLHRRPLLHHALAVLQETLPDRVTVVADPADVRRAARAGGNRSVPVMTPAEWQQETGARPGPLLVHDPLCPLVGSDFLGEVLAAGAPAPGSPSGAGTSVVAYRPVTDTVKNMPSRHITGTVDRETLATVASPLLVAPDVVARAAATPGPEDRLPWESATALATWLHRQGPVRMLRAPSLARRVDDLASLHLLQCLDEVRRRTRRG